MARFCSMAIISCLMAVSLSGCGSENGMSDVLETIAGEETGSSAEDSSLTDSAVTEGEQASVTAKDIIIVSEMFTDRDLEGEYDAAEAEKISLSEGDVTITEEGVYLLSGTLTDGMVIVDADESAKVQLVLDGVEIYNSTNAAVYVKQADKVFITLAEGSENSLASGGYTSIDDNNIDAVIFAKCDVTVNGTGSLTVSAEEGHGMVSKDDLKITGGDITVTAQNQGLSGKDSVRVTGACLNITSGKDGIHAEHDENSEKGFVYIADGTLQITAAGDGISASSVIQIDGGKAEITAGGGSTNKTTAADENGDTVSTKGIKASGELAVNGGTIAIDSQDDAVHSNNNVIINGGELSLATGDDGIHADETALITGGSIRISDSYEGIEGNNVEISGGNITLYATDDGLNAAGGNDQSGFGGMFGRGERFGNTGTDTAEGNAAESDVPSIVISGGVIYVRAEGDGLDSNGTLIVTGGEVYVSGPSDGGNGAIDYESSGQITGGTAVAVGNSAMAMNFGDTSTQGSIMITTSMHEAGTVVTLKDSGGKELVSYVTECEFNSIVISCPELVLGGTYTITAGEESTEVTLSDCLIYGSGFGMGGFGGHGGFGGGGQAPGGGERPDGAGMELPDRGMNNGEMPEGMELPGGGTPDGNMPEGMELPDGERPDGEMSQFPGGQGGNSGRNN